MHAGAALAGAGLGLGHAMAQALGGRYGISHGAANAVCLPPALRFNEPVAAAEIARFGEAIGSPDDAAGKAEELARLAGFERLRDLGVPERAPARRRGGGRARRREGEPAPGVAGGNRRAPARGLVGIRAWPRTGASRSTSTTRATARSSSSGSPRAVRVG